MSIKNYGLITSIEELRDIIEQITGNVFGFDIETGYEGDDREKAAVRPELAIIAGISFTDSPTWARYVPLGHDDADNLDNRQAAQLFWDLLATGKGVAHNALFELKMLARWFMKFLADDETRGEQVRASNGYFTVYSDTLVEAYLMADFQRFALKPLTLHMFHKDGTPAHPSEYASRIAEIARITKEHKDKKERKAALLRFDGHIMTELAELFPDLPANRLKFLRFNTLPLDARTVEYACEDSAWCLAIHEHYHRQVKDKLLYKVEMAIIQDVLPAMEDEGLVFDWLMMSRTATFLHEFRDRYNAEIMAELSQLCGEPVAVNLASAAQLSKILFEKLGYRTNVYTTGTRDLPMDERKMSTGKIALERLAQEYPVVQKIREWRKMTKLLASYLDTYEKQYDYAPDGRVHSSLLSCFVITGRFASAEPNVQQLPKKYHYDLQEGREAHAAGLEPPVGTCFKFNFRDVVAAPPDHYILGFDLSQAELRAVAGEAGETALLEAFNRGDDVHRLTAALMLDLDLDDVTDEHRDLGKTYNFALLYGMSTKGLADRLGIPVEQAQVLMDKYFAGLPAIAAYMSKQIEQGKNYGYVTSRFGRKLPIWEYRSDNPYIYSKGDRACVNYPIQGAATGDLMKIMMVRIHHAIRKANLADKVKMVMNIHDALEFYVHKDLEPKDVYDVLRPAIIFPIPGWPEMRADWHLARRWGSPIELEETASGDLVVKGSQIKEAGPEIEIDENGDEVEVLPEVDPEVLAQAAAGPGRVAILTLMAMPTDMDWARFVSLVRATPGNHQIHVITPEGDVTLPYTTALTPQSWDQITGILGPVTMNWATDQISM